MDMVYFCEYAICKVMYDAHLWDAGDISWWVLVAVALATGVLAWGELEGSPVMDLEQEIVVGVMAMEYIQLEYQCEYNLSSCGKSKGDK